MSGEGRRQGWGGGVGQGELIAAQEVVLAAGEVRVRQQPRATGEVGRHAHADAHGFAMEVGGVLRLALQGVAEGVAVVEVGAYALLQLVLLDVPGLDAAGFRHGVGHGGGVAGFQGFGVGFLPGEERRVVDDAVLEDLGQAGAVFAAVHGGHQFRVDDHGLGLAEGTDQVLAGGGIHAGLAAHGGIHHGQQGGGHLQEAHAAHPARGHEAREVAGHAAAEAEDGVAAVDLGGGGGGPHALRRGHGLRRFARGEGGEGGRQAGGAQAGFQTGAVQAGHGFIGNDEDLGALEARSHQGADAVQASGGDGDVVGAVAEGDVDGGGHVSFFTDGQTRRR